MPDESAEMRSRSADVPVPVARAAEQRGDPSLFDLLNALLLHRRLVIGLPLLLFAIAVAFSMSQPRTWTASASFMPQRTTSGGGQLAGMAAQFGFSLPGAETGASTAFYGELLRSRAVVGAVLDSSYTVGGSRVELVDLLVPRGTSPEQRRDDALEELRGALDVAVGRETGLISFSVATVEPEVSSQVAALMLALVNEFNLEKRQLQAAAERRFVEERLASAREELRDAEQALQQFQETNRRFMESPQLVLEYGRYEHETMLRRQIVTSLAEAYERARIDEVRNLPLITIMDYPEPPVRPNGRGTVVRGLVALVLGFGIAATYALVRTSLVSARARSGEDAELFHRLRGEALRDVASPLRRISGVVRPGRARAGGNGGSVAPAGTEPGPRGDGSGTP